MPVVLTYFPEVITVSLSDRLLSEEKAYHWHRFDVQKTLPRQVLSIIPRNVCGIYINLHKETGGAPIALSASTYSSTYSPIFP